MAGYLKAVWPEFCGSVFGVWAAPGGFWGLGGPWGLSYVISSESWKILLRKIGEGMVSAFGRHLTVDLTIGPA